MKCPVGTAKKPFLAILLTLFFMSLFMTTFTVSLSALTIDEGDIRLELHEKSGRFSLYYLNGRYIPLFFERDPRTSSIGLLVDNNTVIPDSASGFDQTLERTSRGARFIWTSSDLRVTEEFKCISSNRGGAADGIEIEVTVHNRKRRSVEAGIHFLADTHLAEDKGAHFVTSAGGEITGETEFSSPVSMPEYWLSPGDFDSFDGLQVMLKGRGITTPDRVVFANWKRLSDNLWKMESRGDRSFNLPPYSINDSAAVLFFDPVRLTPNSSRSVTIVLGAARGTAFTAAGAAADGETEKTSPQEDPPEEDAEVREVQGSEEEEDLLLEKIRKNVSDAAKEKDEPVEEDLAVVNDILSNIESLLSSPEEISDEKVDLLEEALSSLEDRTKNYNSSSE
ncbi:MAG: hypothetical protein ACLFNZ_04140 [Spirochaetaceae bacterium]